MGGAPFCLRTCLLVTSELPLKASENHLSARSFPALLLPPIESERESDKAEQRPQGTGAGRQEFVVAS